MSPHNVSLMNIGEGIEHDIRELLTSSLALIKSHENYQLNNNALQSNSIITSTQRASSTSDNVNIIPQW